jgi:hypothetical protein
MKFLLWNIIYAKVFRGFLSPYKQIPVPPLARDCSLPYSFQFYTPPINGSLDADRVMKQRTRVKEEKKIYLEERKPEINSYSILISGTFYL